MLREGHFGLNALLYAPAAVLIGSYGSIELALMAGVIVIGTANLPDIDTRLPIITHRGITHTVWFAVLMGTLIGGASTLITLPQSEVVLFAIGFFSGVGGVFGHLMGDMLTPWGIRPWRPIRDDKYSLDLTNANNARSNQLLLSAGGILLIMAFAVIFQHVYAGKSFEQIFTEAVNAASG